MSQEEQGGTRRRRSRRRKCHGDPRGTVKSQEEPGGGMRSQEEPGFVEPLTVFNRYHLYIYGLRISM